MSPKKRHSPNNMTENKQNYFKKQQNLSSSSSSTSSSSSSSSSNNNNKSNNNSNNTLNTHNTHNTHNKVIKNEKENLNPIQISADDSYLSRIPKEFHTNDITMSSLTTPRRPIGHNNIARSPSLSIFKSSQCDEHLPNFNKNSYNNNNNNSNSNNNNSKNKNNSNNKNNNNHNNHNNNNSNKKSNSHFNIFNTLNNLNNFSNNNSDNSDEEIDSVGHLSLPTPTRLDIKQSAYHQKYTSVTPSEILKPSLTTGGITQSPKVFKQTTTIPPTPPPALNDDLLFSLSNFTWKKFLLSEIFGIGESRDLAPAAVETIDNFLSVPLELEKFMFFGFVLSLDSFLYTITYVPLRFILSVILLIDEFLGYFLILRPLNFLFSILTTFNLSNSIQTSSTRTHSNKYQFVYSSLRQFDFIKGILLLAGWWSLSQIDMSWLYHYIRQQNTIKLYALTAMMEIIDKLFCSLGVDVFDSLLFKIFSKSTPFELFKSSIVITFYVIIHSMLYFFHILTLIVAINNFDQSLITILILNNFAEIKSFIMKKYDEAGLYELSCSDINERFKIILFYVFVFIVNITQLNSNKQQQNSPSINNLIYSNANANTNNNMNNMNNFNLNFDFDIDFEFDFNFSASSTIFFQFFQLKNILGLFDEYSQLFVIVLLCEMFVDCFKHSFIIKFNDKFNSNVYKKFHKKLTDLIFDNKTIVFNYNISIVKELKMAVYPLCCVFMKCVLFDKKFLVNFQQNYQKVIFNYTIIFMILIIIKIIFGGLIIYYIKTIHNNEIIKTNEEQMKEYQRQSKVLEFEKLVNQHDH